MTSETIMPSMLSNPPAVVLSCAGAPDGDLNAVRSLGSQGIRTVLVSEYENPPARYSRYCSDFIHLPDYTQHPALLAAALDKVAGQAGCAPVVIPTADPDVLALEQAMKVLGSRIRAVLPDPEIIRQLTRKDLFDSYSVRNGMPVPQSCVPRTLDEVRAFAQQHPAPYIVKPESSGAWRHPLIDQKTARTRAFVIQDEAELLRICSMLAPIGLRLILQEYVPGEDDEHYTVDVFIGRDGSTASCAGVKLRHFPPHVGAGCYCQSLHMPELENIAIRIMQKIGFVGVANLDFKRHATTGEFKLFEINPRLSHWHILATRSGVNLPLLAYNDAVGRPSPPVQRRSGLRYLNGRHDMSAARQYIREGQLSWGDYLRSLAGMHNVYQRLSLHDLKPFLFSLRRH